MHTFNPYEYLITEHKIAIDRDLFKSSIKGQHTKLMEVEAIRPGILDYLDKAKAVGLKIGLASSSSRVWVDQYLKQLDIAHYFDCIRTADNVKKVKPDPELYLQTLECLGVEAQEAIAIEDSPNGAKAAEAAGMHCVAIPNSITQFLEFGLVNYRLISLADLEFDELLANPSGTSL
ncbi:Phosphorylated carbohydrates phosphatase [compost metagenome]